MELAGRTISHYRLLDKLGEGGMGVVYRAEDIRLGRNVALKLLPASVSAGAEERRRLLNEARAAATISHPNVAHIYEIGDETGEPFIAMELIQGTVLRERIGSLTVDESVAIAIGVAEGLAEAHRHGIIHRDIKPENIMLRSSGVPVIMDFGVARLEAATHLTMTGTTRGTAAYMAPEQIQEGDVDPRSDIFSLGVMLYEMLAGVRPFKGLHEAALIYQIVNVDPPPLSSLKPDIDPSLDAAVMRALAKDPADRQSTAIELARELHGERVLETAAPEMERPAPAAASVSVSKETRPRRRWGMIGAIVAGVLGLAAIGWYLFRPEPRVDFDKSMRFRPLQIPVAATLYPGLSGDGNWTVFCSQDSLDRYTLYYMNTAGGDPKPLVTDSLPKTSADISPDGSRIIYSAGQNLYMISTLGGESRLIATRGDIPRWSPDGGSIAFIRNVDFMKPPEVWLMEPDGSNLRMLVADSIGGGPVSLSWSAKGKKFAWLRSFRHGDSLHQEIMIYDISSGKERQLTFDRHAIDQLAWMPEGEIVYATDRGGPVNLWAINSDGGESVQITRGGGHDTGPRSSSDGKRLLYVQMTNVAPLWITDVTGTNRRQLTPDDQITSNPSFSSDGSRIVYIGASRDAVQQTFLWMIDRDGSNRRQITRTAQAIEGPVWSHDGRMIAYSTHHTTHDDIDHTVWLIDLDRPGVPREIGPGIAVDFTPDHGAVIVRRNNRTWEVPLDGAAPRAISDDSTLVYPSLRGDRQAVVKSTYNSMKLLIREPDGSVRLLSDSINNSNIEWTHDGSGIHYMINDRSYIVSIATGVTSPYPTTFPLSFDLRQISRSNREVVYTKPRSTSKLIMIEGMR